MNTIEHKVVHYVQPTNHTCSQAALAMLLSCQGYNTSPEELSEKLPVNYGDDGEAWGSVNQQLATWCIGQGFDVTMVSSDIHILGLSWRDLPQDEIVERLQQIVDRRDVPMLGKDWTKLYIESYTNFIQAGGGLRIVPYISSEILDQLLQDGPILACVNSNVFHMHGREINLKLHETKIDDIDGKLTNHSIVIRGKTDTGDYLIADPWPIDSVETITPEHLVVSIAAAQMECDNLVFQIRKKP